MRTNKDPRHIARILAVVDLYTYFYKKVNSLNNSTNSTKSPDDLVHQTSPQPDNTENLTENFVYNKLKDTIIKIIQKTNFSKTLKQKLIQGVRENCSIIDDLIDEYSEPIKHEDLDLLTLLIIRIAIYEAFIAKITPHKVAIDEAIEVARDFGLEHEIKKINAILDKIYKESLKQNDLKKTA